MKRKHHKGQQHYSGKELLEQRNAERKEQEKRLKEEKRNRKRERAYCFYTVPIRHLFFMGPGDYPRLGYSGDCMGGGNL